MSNQSKENILIAKDAKVGAVISMQTGRMLTLETPVIEKSKDSFLNYISAEEGFDISKTRLEDTMKNKTYLKSCIYVITRYIVRDVTAGFEVLYIVNGKPSKLKLRQQQMIELVEKQNVPMLNAKIVRKDNVATIQGIVTNLRSEEKEITPVKKEQQPKRKKDSESLGIVKEIIKMQMPTIKGLGVVIDEPQYYLVEKQKDESLEYSALARFTLLFIREVIAHEAPKLYEHLQPNFYRLGWDGGEIPLEINTEGLTSKAARKDFEYLHALVINYMHYAVHMVTKCKSTAYPVTAEIVKHVGDTSNVVGEPFASMVLANSGKNEHTNPNKHYISYVLDVAGKSNLAKYLPELANKTNTALINTYRSVSATVLGDKNAETALAASRFVIGYFEPVEKAPVKA